MFDKDITLINKWFNKTTKMNEYKIHYVKGFWSSNNGISISDTQLVKADGVTVYILMSEIGYVDPKVYQKLTTINHEWTLQNDDYLVKGKIESEVKSINDILDNYECMKITNVAVKDYGSSDMCHFAITGE